jgi:hypothetical protein
VAKCWAALCTWIVGCITALMLFVCGKRNVDGKELGSVISVSMHCDVYCLRI